MQLFDRYVVVGMLIGAMICISAFELVRMHHRVAEREAAFTELSRTLQPFVTPPTGLRPNLHTLRLHRYWVETRLDPLFAFPGVDLERLPSSIYALEDSQNLFIEVYTPDEQRLIHDALFPLTFLKSTLETEALRRTFFENPVPEVAVQYHRALMNTIDAYIADTERLHTTVRSMEGTGLAFWAGTTTSAHVASQISLAHTYAVHARKKEQRRFACLQGDENACTPIRLSTTTPPTLPPSPHSLPSTIARHRTIVEDFIGAREFWVSYVPTGEALSEQRIVALNDSVCVDEHPTYYYTWWNDARTSGERAFWMTELNDLYFYDTALTTGAYFSSINEAGVPYQWQPTYPYICIDYGLDAGRVLTAQFIYHALHDEPLVTGLETSFAPVQTLQEYEDALRATTDVLFVDELDAFMRALINLRATYTEAQLAAVLGPDRVLRMNILINTWRSQSVGWESLMGSFDDTASSAQHVHAHQSIPLFALFLTRGYASSLLQLGNHTIVPEPLHLLATPEPPAKRSFFLVSYRDTLRAQYPAEQMSTYLMESGKTVGALRLEHE